ncbi:MAG: DNA ligase [Desulfuromonadaceae bacterium]|nr:DNA ligase [Desulfuromonadaceae bacterium]
MLVAATSNPKKFINRVLFSLLLLVLSATLAQAFEPMLPQTDPGDSDLRGWLMSEKLDGVRARWDGRQLWSKNGRKFFPPAEFTRNLPPFAVEGELWGGRGTFEQTVSIVSSQQAHGGWLGLKLGIFDLPDAAGGFSQRIEQARSWLAEHPTDYAFVIEQIPVRDRAQVQMELQRLENIGGEGLIVRRPDSLYRGGRSAEILKVKTCLDAEAKVVAHLPGQGRNAGRLGALLVEEKNGAAFRIGTGFSDEQRNNPPPVGSLVTFKYYGRYASGLPKFPVFLRIRTDSAL